MSKDSQEYFFKILVVGESGVGKTSLINSFTGGSFSQTHVSTIGVDFKVKTVAMDGKIIKLQVWDTAGQERFRTITRSYYRGAHGIVIVYDVGDRSTFENVSFWLSEINKNTDSNHAVKILIGAKSDLEEREVSCEEALEFANLYDMRYIETSSKDSKNVDTAFMTTAKIIKDRMKYMDPINYFGFQDMDQSSITLGHSSRRRNKMNFDENCCS